MKGPRRALALALGVTFASCFACGEPEDPGSDAGHDGGFDGGVDAGVIDGGFDGAIDSGPPDGGPMSVEVETSLEVFSSEPCPDWEPLVDTRPRGLPADATPRQLWRWHAYDDPVYQASGLVNTYLDGGPSIGPDGHLYIIGPERDRVMSVTRAGRMRWLSEPVGGVLLPTIAIAPDGDLFVGQAVEGSPFALIRFSPDGELRGAVSLGGPAWLGDTPDTIKSIAVGPGGMVYVTMPGGRTVATCRGMRLTWTLTATYVSNRTPAWTSRVVVDGVDVLWLSGAFAQTFRLRPTGDVIDAIMEDAHVVTGLRGASADQALIGASELRSSRFWAGVWEDGVFRYRLPEQRQSTRYLLDPTGGVWQVTRRPPEPGAYTFSRWVDETEQWRLDRNVLEPFGYPGAWAADASRIDPPIGGGIRRVLPTGEEAWAHTFDAPGGGPTFNPYAINLDIDGVAYVESGGDIIAFQTDVLPPAAPGCWDLGCNRRRNNWIGSP